jgi:GNAT superfamily N-acetyltransferase
MVMSGHDQFRLTSDFKQFENEYLELEYESSRRYTFFVYDREEDAREIARLAFATGEVEFSPPWGRLLLDEEDQILGMTVGLPADQLRVRRMQLANIVTRSTVVKRDPQIIARLRISREAFVAVGPTDYYWSRMCVTTRARGKGLARLMGGKIESEARELGCKRIVGDTYDTRLYLDLGFSEIGSKEVHDPESGRKLQYFHIAKELV